MSAPASRGVAGIVGTVLRGLRARALLSAGSVLLTALAIGSAVLGPSFQVAVTNSYAITRLGEAPVAATGISRVWSPATSYAGTPAQGVDAAREAVRGLDDGPWRAPDATLVSTRFSALRGLVTMWSREDACAHLEVEGRCPQRSGEVLLLAGDAEKVGAKVGKPLRLDIFEPGEIAGQHPRPPMSTVTVVGTYSTPGEAEEDFWFAPLRLTSTAEQATIRGGYQPYAPSPLLTVPETFEQMGNDQWSVRVDTRLDVRSDLTTADIDTAVAAAARVGDRTVELDDATLQGDPLLTDLAAVDQEIRDQQDTARASISPGVLSIVLVALALLMRLLMAAGEIRVPELALASLRGLSSRRLWALGLAEPLLVLALSVPLGVALGLGMAVGLTRWWLLPGLPVPLPAASFVAAGLVLAAAVLVAVVAVGLVVHISLATALAGVRRPGRSQRWAVVVELTLAALAVAVLASKLAGGSQKDPDGTDLVLPVLLAVVAGLATTRLIAVLAAWWSRHNRTSRSLSGFISSRAISRRQEGTLVILPITAAVAVAVFGAGVHDSAATWRASVASTVAPAHTVWHSPLPLRDTVELTRRLDPDGEHVMAAASVVNTGASFSVVDATRLASVADWPESWSPGRSAQEVADAITPAGVVPTLVGRRVSLTVDNQARTGKPLAVEVRLGTRNGRPQRAYLGPFGAGTTTASTRLPGCLEGCPLEGLSVAGGAGTTMEMEGRVVLSGLSVDGTPVPGVGAEAGWVPSPDSQARSAIADLAVEGDTVVLDLDSQGAPAMARLVSGAIPRDRAVLRGVDVDDLDLADLNDGYGLVPVGPVGTLESMPFLGPRGLLIDYASYTTDLPVYDNLNDVRVLMAEDAPASLDRELAAAGLSVETTFAAEQRTLDQSAYALALRLYAVVAALVLLMALAGLVVSTAVQLPARRRDAAALRVVGVPRRAVMGGIVRELLVVLGGAALAGVLAGSLAQYVVLRTITLGYVERISTPHLIAAIDPLRLLALAATAVVVLGVIALVFSQLTVRGARGSTLRENAR